MRPIVLPLLAFACLSAQANPVYGPFTEEDGAAPPAGVEGSPQIGAEGSNEPLIKPNVDPRPDDPLRVFNERPKRLIPLFPGDPYAPNAPGVPDPSRPGVDPLPPGFDPSGAGSHPQFPSSVPAAPKGRPFAAAICERGTELAMLDEHGTVLAEWTPANLPADLVPYLQQVSDGCVLIENTAM
jgi:hypothetical protein